MEENANLTMEPTADQPGDSGTPAGQTAQEMRGQPDAFLEGWDDVSDEPEADQPTEPGAEQTGPGGAETTAEAGAGAGAETAAGEKTAETPAEPNAPTDEAQKEQQAAPKSWTLKHMDSEITLTADDAQIPALLQKGIDYDRIRAKYDEAKPVMEMFGEFARQAGMSVSDYAKFIRAEAKKAQGMSADEAKRAVELEDREAAIAAQETAQREAAQAKEAQDRRVRSDLAEFAKAFPDVYTKAASDPKAIPKEVWDGVHAGLSLTAAYARYAVAQAGSTAKAAQEQAAAASKQAQNAVRSTGSMKSAGNDAKNTDPFLEGWDED